MARFEISDDGIPGLTLALRLRLKGHAVALVDTSAKRALASVFTLPAPYRDLFLKTGAAIEDVLGIEAAPGRSFEIEGVSIDLPSVGQHSTVIAERLGTKAGEQWSELMRHAAEVWSALRKGGSESDTALRGARHHALHDRRLRQLLDEYVSEHGLLVGSSGIAAGTLPYLDQTFGRWRFVGGMSALEQELRQRCEALEVQWGSNAGEYLSLESFWTGSFTTAQRRWKRMPVNQVAMPVNQVASHSLGLPWIGMAAEHIAERIGRAS